MNETRHTRGPIKAVRDLKPRFVLEAPSANIAVTIGGCDELNARLLAAAFTSYDLHCGPLAIECAEGDLLGEALKVCKIVTEVFNEQDNCNCPLCKLLTKAKIVIAKATGKEEGG